MVFALGCMSSILLYFTDNLLLIVIIAVLLILSFFREVAYTVCRRDKEKLREFAKRLSNKVDLSTEEWAEVADQILKETYP